MLSQPTKLHLSWTDAKATPRFIEAAVALLAGEAPTVRVFGPSWHRDGLTVDEALEVLHGRWESIDRLDLLTEGLGNWTLERVETQRVSLTCPVFDGSSVERRWLQYSPSGQSPIAQMALPLCRDGLHRDALNDLVILASACGHLETARAEGPPEWCWSPVPTEDSHKVVLDGSGRPFHTQELFLSPPSPPPVLVARPAWKPPTDPTAVLASLSGAIGPLAPCPIHLVRLADVETPPLHRARQHDAVLIMRPETGRVTIGVDDSMPPDQILTTALHAVAHLRLSHVRPGDRFGHQDTPASIESPSARWDREASTAFPSWFTPDVPKRSSLAECSPIEKSWLVLLDHIGRMVGEARTLHPAATRYQSAVYQRQAAQRLVAQLEDYGGAMLCDGVGLGKTYVATTVLVHYANAWRDRLAEMGRSVAEDPFRITILAPNSVVSTWQREALAPLAAHGVAPSTVRVLSHTVLSRIESSSAILERKKGQPSDMEHLLLSDLVVVDEAHNFRSVSARRTLVLRDLLRLQPRKDVRRRVLLLTATPVNNSLDDLRQEISLLFCRPTFFNNNATVDGYRQRVPRDIEDRIAKARRSSDEVSPTLILGAADAKFSFGIDFRNDLKLGVKVEDIAEYLREQEKRLELLRASIKAAMIAKRPLPAEPVRVAADLLDRIVVQRSRSLCKQIEREQGSEVRLLFRPDAPPPERLVYDDEYDGESDVLARFLPLFATGDEAVESRQPPLSLKVYMWADVREGEADASDSSPVVGLQRVLVLKRLESSPVSFLITVLRLLSLHAFRLKNLSDHAHDLGERTRAEALDEEIVSLIKGYSVSAPDALARVDLLLTGSVSSATGRDLIKRWSKAHLTARPASGSDDLPATQLGLYARAVDTTEAATKRDQFERLWALRDDLVRDFGILLGVAPGLADIVFGRFARDDWPRKFCSKGAVDWPRSANWGRRIVTDAKIRRLVGRLLRGRADGQKIVVFSQFTDTLAYVESVFTAAVELGRTDWPLVLGALSGEIGRSVTRDDLIDLIGRSRVVSGETEDRDSVIDAFAPFYRIGPRPPSIAGIDVGEQARLVDLWRQRWKGVLNDPVDILLASDVLAEGVNLQDVALLINYDVHWNPVRMIQRAGRIDRRLNPAIEEAKEFPELDELARETGSASPCYWWHGRAEAAPVTVNLLLSDDLEKELALRERISNKTLAIDFTLGLEQGTGAEAEWMTGYQYQGISALNAWQRDRAIEQVAGYQQRLRRLLAERTIDPDWLERWNGWLREVGIAEDTPIIAWAAASVAASAREGSRFLTPRLVEGVSHWLWSPLKPANSKLNQWIALDGRTSPATTRTDLPWSEDASRPVNPEDLLLCACRIVEASPNLEECGRDIGRKVYQGIPAVLAGYFSAPGDRRSLRVATFRFLQLTLPKTVSPTPDTEHAFSI